ncbi:hypothetical protein [Croceimicrobium sp.]|uniref:hypothetical protein n=1 Tax=Croceimicrobium sp. TaxID=2828340 RepID=UPI003BABD87C
MEAPKLPSFIRQNKHKTFEFQPRYYSESKERIDNLRQKYHGTEESPKPERRASMLRDEMALNWKGSRQSNVSSSNRKLLYIIVGLAALTYYLIMN